MNASLIGATISGHRVLTPHPSFHLSLRSTHVRRHRAGCRDTLGPRAHSPAAGETGRNEGVSGSCCKSEWVWGGDPQVGEVFSEAAASQLGAG